MKCIMDNQAKYLKVEKDKKRLSQKKERKECQKRARKYEKENEQALEENRIVGLHVKSLSA